MKTKCEIKLPSSIQGAPLWRPLEFMQIMFLDTEIIKTQINKQYIEKACQDKKDLALAIF